MSHLHLIQKFLLPELKFLKISGIPHQKRCDIFAEKTSLLEVCPKCATPSSAVYDRRCVVIKDAPVRNKHFFLHITKRRFMCKACKKPFTEPVRGIRSGFRTTERFRRSLLWACEQYADLSSVKRSYRCSSGLIYKALYQQLELRRKRHINYPWPKVIGIDEHYFKRNKSLGIREFASVFVDFKARRLREVVQGKNIGVLEDTLKTIPGRENVTWVVMDLCQTFKSFSVNFFKNAQIVADKFHVLKLLVPAINKKRKAITGDKRSLLIRRLLLRNGYKLDYWRRKAVEQWLNQYPELLELYRTKEDLHRLYRNKSPKYAAMAFTKITDKLALSSVPELQTLRKTLIKWRTEILNYFKKRITNAITEGFNNKAKLVKRRAYGYRSFQNYRLRLLNACS